jgi:hypothetical protein
MLGRPLAKDRPCFDGLSQDERLVRPFRRELFWCQIRQASDGVTGGDVGDVGLKGGVSALEGPVEDI